MTTLERRPDGVSQSIGRGVPVPLSLEDLTTLSLAEAARDNEDLALWGREVFEWSGFQFQLSRASGPLDAALWLQMQVAGQGVLVGLSAAVASALLKVDQLTLEDISPSVLSLWVHRRLSQRWPTHLPLVTAALRREDLAAEIRRWPLQSTWCAVSGSPAKPTGLGLSIWSEDPCPVEWLRDALSPWFVGQRPAALRYLSLPWPLVAARWTVDADVLTDLAVGDVLLLN
jgi:hypothetical protein